MERILNPVIYIRWPGHFFLSMEWRAKPKANNETFMHPVRQVRSPAHSFCFFFAPHSTEAHLHTNLCVTGSEAEDSPAILRGRMMGKWCERKNQRRIKKGPCVISAAGLLDYLLPESFFFPEKLEIEWRNALSGI